MTPHFTGRCPRCSRILFLNAHRKLPRHRTPPPSAEKGGHVRLTGADATWCTGGATV